MRANSLFPETPEEEPEVTYAPLPEGGELVDVAVSVSSYLRTLNDALAEHPAIVRGEVTEVRAYPSGLYFTVKDAGGAEGVLNCYLPPYRAKVYAHLVTHGAELRLGGTPKISPRKGGFSFQVEGVEAVGEGALRAAYEKLKRDLAAEGLFARELPVPLAVRRIGVITSRAGAVIDDFRKNLEPRGYQVLLHDARVEGVRAVPSILAAVRYFAEHAEGVDVVVVMRGGGSLEDLQAFNSEAVARAVASLPVPVIAAIGHDRDVPIANMAADRSTSTPSIAAMLINQSWQPVDRAATLGAARLRGAAQGVLARVSERVNRAGDRLAARLAATVAYPDQLARRIQSGFAASVERVTQRLLAVERELAIVDPQRTLRLGYSILTDGQGTTIRSVRDVREGMPIRARVADGTVSATVTSTTHEDRTED